MANRLRLIQPVVKFAALRLDGDLSLDSLAAQAGLSPFHLHRVFSTTAGETPKHFTLRLRLGRAAVMLLVSRKSVLDVALECGFQSHEVFSRAFRRRFGISSSAYRERGFVNTASVEHAKEHARFVEAVGPCVGFYHTNQEGRPEQNDMTYTVTKTSLAPQPVLMVRRSVKRSEIAATIADALQKIFLYAQQNGIALTGLPLARYPEVGQGLVTIEPAMRVAAASAAAGGISGSGEVIADTLPGGPAATTLHAGKYEDLHEAYGAIAVWMREQGVESCGAPWECYVTDPAEHPDPKDWKTEIFWPLAS